MSKKTITKNFAFVILLIVFGTIFFGCHSTASTETANANRRRADASGDYAPPEIVGAIKSKDVNESSGIAASKCQRGVFWTHNDSGDAALIYAFDETGATLGAWQVKDAKNRDWEDLATAKNADGECVLYIGDIGDNERKHEEISVYAVKEPTINPANKNSSRENPLTTEAARRIEIEYPDSRYDAETLLVHPTTGDIYILTKRLRDQSAVYKLAANYSFERTNRLEKIADFTVPSIPFGFLTGGDVSTDGKRVVIADYLAAYEITLPAAAKNFDDIWREKPRVIDLGAREQGEAICYAANDEAIYATSEKISSPIIKVKRK